MSLREKAARKAHEQRTRDEPGWDGGPIPLDDTAAELPAFPLEVFPAALADLIAGAAEAVGCPPDYGAAHALAVAAGAIGGSFDLQVKRGYCAPSNLFVCVVAPPGSGKSPAVAPILEPVYAEQARARQSFRAGLSTDTKPVYVSDVTVEKLAVLLDENPRGLLMAWDEMAGWLTSFNQYKAKGAGNDRSHYLSIWDGRALKVDRKGGAGKDAAPVFVHRPRLSVVGGIQPEVLDHLRAGPSDGLFDRLLTTYPRDPGLPVESFAEVDDDLRRRWSEAYRQLRGLAMHQAEGDELPRPHVAVLHDDARPVWRDWTAELAARAGEPDAPPYYRSVAAKISGYAARLALVLHLTREVYGETHGYGVDADGVRRGTAVARYFLAHAERVHRSAGRDHRLPKAEAVRRWALARDGADKGFTRGDAWDALRRNSLFAKPEDLDEPLKLLEAHRWVRFKAADGRSGVRGGQSPGRYELNPAALGERPCGIQSDRSD